MRRISQLSAFILNNLPIFQRRRTLRKEVSKMSKKIFTIIAVLIAVLLIGLSFFVDDILPILYGATALNLINIVAFAVSMNKEKSSK